MVAMNKRYTNGESTVFWKPRACAHSGNCFRRLSAVFHPQQRPWITMTGALSSKKLREDRA